MGLESYVRSRARFQRVSDAKIFSGWIQNVMGNEVTIECSAATELEVGQEFFVQAFGPAMCAVFSAKADLRTDQQILFRLSPPIRYVPATEDARMKIEGMIATVTSAEEPFETQIVDASRMGLGLVSPVLLEKGAKITVVLDTKHGEVEAAAEVRYCRQESSEEGQFRVGIRLMELDRLAQAKWNRVLVDIAA